MTDRRIARAAVDTVLGSTNHYEVLSVDFDVTSPVIKASWIRLNTLIDAAKGCKTSDLNAARTMLLDAYNCLKSSVLRESYDKTLRNKREEGAKRKNQIQDTENKRVKHELMHLKRELYSLGEELRQVKGENSRLNDENQTFRTQIKKLQDQIAVIVDKYSIPQAEFCIVTENENMEVAGNSESNLVDYSASDLIKSSTDSVPPTIFQVNREIEENSPNLTSSFLENGKVSLPVEDVPTITTDSLHVQKNIPNGSIIKPQTSSRGGFGYQFARGQLKSVALKTKAREGVKSSVWQLKHKLLNFKKDNGNGIREQMRTARSQLQTIVNKGKPKEDSKLEKNKGNKVGTIKKSSTNDLDMCECEFCNKKFCSRSSLNQHRTLHIDPASVTCFVCSHVFSRKSDVKRHLINVHKWT